jgi:hypothetical protein
MTAAKRNLDQLKEQAPSLLTDEIQKSLKEIKDICAESYWNQKQYGNAALNRKMLLDARIAERLTPEVLTYLFTNEPNEEAKITRTGGEINLRDAIYYGLSDGLQVLKLLPNNESVYTLESYEEQKANFANNTMRIVSNINQSVGVKSYVGVEQELNPNALAEQYERIVSSVNLIKKSDLSANLLNVPGFTADQMRDQAHRGFKHICMLLKIDPKKITLDKLCEQFLQSPETMINGQISHLFYDRAHIDAALEQDTQFNLGGKNYKLQDFFRVMVTKVANNPDNYPACAKEQLCLRMDLVEKDLKSRFATQYEKANDIMPLKNIVTDYKTHLEKQLQQEGLPISAKASEAKTPMQEKLINRYQAITQLQEQIKEQKLLDLSNKASAKEALSTCLKNKPDWSERPFLVKLTDVLSLGIKPIYRAYFSKEAKMEQDIQHTLSTPKLGR